MSYKLPSDPQNFAEVSDFFWKLGLDTIKELETPEGILASSRQEIYGCIFGRDSLVTSLKLLKAYQHTKQPYFLNVVKKVLTTLTALQGKVINIESGEEPGKCIHEFRTSHYEHLTQHPSQPWYLYPDKIMRNFDSVDATPLLLITIYRYWQQSGDQEFLDAIQPNVELALDWLAKYGDGNNDGFVDYHRHPQRKFGGLTTQNWMDSEESVFFECGKDVVFPMAPVEVQAYSYLALSLWENYYSARKNFQLAETLRQRKDNLKALFNQRFVLVTQGGWAIASGLDGLGRPLLSPRSSMGHVLWASKNPLDDGAQDAIIDHELIPHLVKRLMQPDLFEPQAGIRTLSSGSAKFVANSYHNGSIWPHDNSMIAEGLQQWKFAAEAAAVRRALLKALNHFGTPIELFVFENGQYREYLSDTGQGACRKQAWSAASLLTASLSLIQKQENSQTP